jgi:hypothetical protein
MGGWGGVVGGIDEHGGGVEALVVVMTTPATHGFAAAPLSIGKANSPCRRARFKFLQWPKR